MAQSIMQRRHFELIAEALHNAKASAGNQYRTPNDQWNVCVEMMVRMLATTNPNFDATQFRLACE